MADQLHAIEASALHARRERVFLILAGIFLGTMAMLNILGITKFIHFGPLQLAVGVLPYPLTFLCTDFISELYGRRRAGFVVFCGLIVNLIVLGFVWFGDIADPIDFRSPEQRIVTMDYINVKDADGNNVIDPATDFWLSRPAVEVPSVDEPGATQLKPVERFDLRPVPGGPPEALRLVDADTGQPIIKEEMVFSRIATLTRQAMLASMIAYLLAQFIDVYLFHFWKRVTKGRYLWIRNNGSTMISQLVDTTAVVCITFWAQIVSGEKSISSVMVLIGGGYAFKLIVAALDTIPFYLGVPILARYLRIDPRTEHNADVEGAQIGASP